MLVGFYGDQNDKKPTPNNIKCHCEYKPVSLFLTSFYNFTVNPTLAGLK